MADRSRFAHAWGWAGVLALCVAWQASAATAGSEPTVQQVLQSSLPGEKASTGLQRSLTAPTAEARWRGLPWFGRELFARAESLLAPVEGAPVGPDYVLGPGDDLIVFMSGLTDTSYALHVDREGKVFLPRVGSTFVWGLAFADAEALIRGRLATVLRNARIHVSMGRIRAIEVFVLGAVERPGKVPLTGMATALNALSAAGGPSALGSLRDIRVLRANQEVAQLDLYPFLLNGDRSHDARLQSGDVVFVGLSRPQVGIQGAVRRPAVFESQGPLTLRELLDMAGGATPFADLSRVRIERVDANGGFRLQDLPLNHGHGVDPDSLVLADFDLVTILPLNERVRNVVTLDGFVRHAGEYELSPGMRLSQLALPERLLPEASLEHAELRRVDPRTFAVTVRTVSLRAAFEGGDDPELRPLDAVSVFSSARFPRSVTLHGEVDRPGVYTVAPGERLSDVLQRAGGVTKLGHLPAAVFERPGVADHQRTVQREFAERQRVELATQQVHLAQAGDSVSAAALARAQNELTRALSGVSGRGRVVLELDERDRWIGTSRDPVLEHGDVISVPVRPVTVTVVGSVMNPGTLMADGSESFGHYLKLAGGPTREADVSRSYVLRANGAAVPRRNASRVHPGDAIIVPPREAARGPLGRSFGVAARFFVEMAAAAALIVAATR